MQHFCTIHLKRKLSNAWKMHYKQLSSNQLVHAKKEFPAVQVALASAAFTLRNRMLNCESQNLLS